VSLVGAGCARRVNPSALSACAVAIEILILISPVANMLIYYFANINKVEINGKFRNQLPERASVLALR
jgi:hypothetical protein